jgi:Predicted membrane protein (DUF2306)
MSMTSDLSGVCQRPRMALASSACTDDTPQVSIDRTVMQHATKPLARRRSTSFLPNLKRMRLFSADAWLRWDAKRLLRLCLIVGAVALTWATGTSALAEASGALDLPYQLVLLDQRLPGIFRIHMAASGLGLILLPCALLLQRQPIAHRILGRAGASSLFIGVAAGLPSAVMSSALPLARLGFLAQGVLCLVLLAQAIAAISKRRVDDHQRAMSRVGAILFGVVVLRLAVVIVSDTEIRFDIAYTIIAWLSWLAPLLIAQRLIPVHPIRRPIAHSQTVAP